MAETKCPQCPSTLASTRPGRVKHNADGSHTFEPAAVPPKAHADKKSRGRPRG